MRNMRWLLVIVMPVAICGTSPAGIFSRKPKANPAEQVPSLIMQLKTDKDEAKRATAADELRNFDPKSFPEILTVLTDALLKDPGISVRAEAAGSIAKLRPINQQAGFALETASANDPSLRVKMAAKQALWQYHLVGYRSGKAADTTAVKAGPALPAPTHTTAKNPRPAGRETSEPPLADGSTTSTSAKPATPQPSAPPKLLTPPSATPAPKSAEPDGPTLGGPLE